MKKLGLLGVSGPSGLAYVVQQLMIECQDHPLFEIAGFIADNPADAGKPLAAAIKEPWQADGPMPPQFADAVLLPPDPELLRTSGLDLVISATPGPVAKQNDPAVAAAGIPVISESAGLRADADVPLIVPELNADHLALVKAQQAARGWDKGFIVSAPLCTAVIAAMVMKPLADAFGLRSTVMTTMQALSGSGWNGVPSLAILDNLLPFIGDEEEKLYAELPKILGSMADGAIAAHPAPLSATATRVPVRDGHTIAMTLAFDKLATPDEVAEVLAGFRGGPEAVALPSAPAAPIVLRKEPNRPQPLLDRVTDDGRVVTVGRIRAAQTPDNAISLVAVGHNHRLGTFGNTLKVAELVATTLL